MGKSFIFSRSDEVYKAKRKACAHAFYKEKLVKMLESIKDKMELYCEKWSAEIEASEDGSTTIDISKVFNEIFARNIFQICFGKDIALEKISILDREDPSKPVEEVEMTLGYATNHIIDQILKTLPQKLGNPLFRPLYDNFGYYLSLTSFE